MDYMLRLGIVVLLIVLGLVGNLVIVTGLWPLCQAKNAYQISGFSRAPAPVLDRLIAAAAIASLILVVLTGLSQLPVLAFDWCPPEVWGVRGQCYRQNVASNFSWMDAAVACQEQEGSLARFPPGRFPYKLPNLDTGKFWVGVVDDGIPRPTCKTVNSKGSSIPPKCVKPDEGCPQIVIASARNVTVVPSLCHMQAGYICDLGPMVVIPGFCQVQGLITSFLSPLVLCYLMLISIERFLHYMLPEEHDLTFSWLNTNVIQVGLMFLLITDATGPVYGWAQYIFSSESGLCILDPGSRYVTTYISVSLPLYYFLPLLVTVCCHVFILLQRQSSHEEDEYPFPSRIIPSGRQGQILLFVSCILPFLGRLPSVLAVMICSSKLSSEASEKEIDSIDDMCREGKMDFFLVWFKFFSLTCLLPLVLILGSPNLRNHVRACLGTKFFHSVCRWKHNLDDFESPIELSTRIKPGLSDHHSSTPSPAEETVEIV